MVSPQSLCVGFLKVCLVFLASGCANLRTTEDIQATLPNTELEIENSPIDDRDASAPAEEPRTPEASVAKNLLIPVELNAKVKHWIQYFTVKDRARFQTFLDRGQLYRDVVENVLEENDLPAELYYLAMIESGYQTNARSHAKAVGVWQFIAGTGDRYGLRIDRHVDERRDPIRATEAAAKYLRDLYNVFGSWHLAMAAYNAGEIRILRAIMKGRTRDFWELVDSKMLPSETANYVPKFLAVVMIGKEPEKYGFRISEPSNPYPELTAVAVPGSLSLQKIAEQSGVPLQTIKRVNPHLNFSRVPASHHAYEIWLPAKAGMASELTFKDIVKTRPRAIARAPRASARSPIHIVRRGENLSTIAQKHKMSVGHLMRINNLRRSRVQIGTKLRTQAKTYEPSRVARYKVRRGDNLTIISRRFKTSTKQIKASNNLKRNVIFVGQVLKIESRN